ncbi:RNA-dependent RNA polymerase 6 [Citrus sinensis]|uniref:RNA-dependent RNA polymerase 6 n=1 Tax=Citrus sinensis TaxID=2711 RepID=A0ACB8JAK3_CITSI|nr:RNA-dependent RNA polymerase 6 [Citrus sinensis]
MEPEEREKISVDTQVSVGGFDRDIKAVDLVKYLENEVGGVWRCRLKTSCTPSESYPNFFIENVAEVQKTDDYEKVEPHAFVHFATSTYITRAMDAAEHMELFLNGRALKVSLGPENPFRLNQRGRTSAPLKLPDVYVEIGSLVTQDEFFVSWRGPASGTDFLVDPFDGTCKFCFTKDTAFALKSSAEHAVIKCEFKVFLVKEIDIVKQYSELPRVAILLRLASSPRICYRTAEDDIEVMSYLRKQRVQEDCLSQPVTIREEPDFEVPMEDPFFCMHYKEGVSFEIMFLVNAVMHKGILNQHQLSDSFFDLLRCQPREVNVTALKHIYSYKRPVFDAYEKLKDVQEWLIKNPKLYEGPKNIDDIAEVRSYYVAPIVKDITSNTFSQKTGVFKRVKSILSDGFNLCGRRYSFLAFSSNQLRDHSAWFFSKVGETSVLDIKNWMGEFTAKNIAKYAARMGLCFSSTHATVEIPPTEVDHELPDIKRNGYVFSDGIGKITPDLAMEVAQILKLDGSPPPSAYQIRYAGYKGVVACWPAKDDGIRMSLRGSMKKFKSCHTSLEICSWTRFQPGFLNRQIITLLSTLNVSDEIFWTVQASMASKLNLMLVASDVAFEVLTASCAEQGNTAAIMLSADELGELKEGQCFIQVSESSLENCFSKHGSRFAETKKLQVINGFVVIAKNPCLHPGDVRILEAVDRPELHHLCDCLVFPQKGDRPHTNEASESDLDGDLYFVTWDENLIPPSKKSCPPMEYTPAEAKPLTCHVNHQNLGQICSAHVVLSEYGAFDENCILLAKLAATAVDSPKTGKIVTMPSHLKPKIYPDFMEKEEYQTYKSNKILGRLYRQIKDAYDENISVSSEIDINPVDIHCDTDLEVPESVDFTADARNQKCSYDGQLNGLLGHAFRKEFRQVFEKMNSDFELSDNEKNVLYEQKASAWYQVTYHREWVKKSLDLLEQGSARSVVLLSFAWIANDYLARIKIKCQEMANIGKSKPVNNLARNFIILLIAVFSIFKLPASSLAVSMFLLVLQTQLLKA